MIPIKTPQEFEIMKKAGQIGAAALTATLAAITPGITTLKLDKIAEDIILASSATPGFKRVAGYDFATCININAGIVHGIPNGYVIKEGDVVSIDLGVYYKGFYSDLAATVEVETSKEEGFLEIGKKALNNAIAQCHPGKRLGDVSADIQETVESVGFTVSKDLVGHGVGRELHEAPQVPCYGTKNTGVILKEGMVLAIEVIYQKGSPGLVLLDDNWTLETADGSLSALFEHSVAITSTGPQILTQHS